MDETWQTVTSHEAMQRLADEAKADPFDKYGDSTTAVLSRALIEGVLPERSKWDLLRIARRTGTAALTLDEYRRLTQPKSDCE